MDDDPLVEAARQSLKPVTGLCQISLGDRNELLDAIVDFARTQIAAALEQADTERGRFERIGRAFAELWELGAPFPVRRWTCDAHAVVGCLVCKAAVRRGEGDERKE